MTDPTTSQSTTSKPRTSNLPSSKFVADLMKKRMTKEETQLVNDCMQVGKEKGMDEDERNKFLNEIMTLSGNNSIIRDDLRKLRPGIWLNDALVNFYLNQCLSKRNESYLFYSTHFFSNLMNEHDLGKLRGKYEFDKVRWLKRQNIFEMKKTFIPINQGNQHWVLVVIDNVKKKIQHYNSMRSTVKEETSEFTNSNIHSNEVQNILRYMNDVHLEKYGKNMNNDWVVEYVVNHPRQKNCELVEIEELFFTLPLLLLLHSIFIFPHLFNLFRL